MKAHVITQFGDVSVFNKMELAKPAIKPGYALVKVHATSVNPIDTKIRAGLVPHISPVFPAILHGDIAGTIVEVGEGVKDLKPGDEVFGCVGGVKGEGGALADFIVADANLIAKKPTILSMTEAAALPLVCITAWEALFEKVKVSSGQQVLVHAGTGGVGHVAIQLAKWAGAKVYTTVSSEKKSEIVKLLGADEVINYKTESVQDYVNRLTNGKGFEVIFDTVGGANIDNSLSAVANYGHVITIQARSSHDLTPLYTKSASLHAVLMLLPLLSHQQRKRHGEILKQISKLVDEGVIKPLIDPHQFTFDDIAKAHALLESGNAIGKIVLHND